MKRAIAVLVVLVVLGIAAPASAAVPLDGSSPDVATRIVRAFRGLLHALDGIDWPKP
jgi:hypothetical protein